MVVIQLQDLDDLVEHLGMLLAELANAALSAAKKSLLVSLGADDLS
jgi:hypothetical protein